MCVFFSFLALRDGRVLHHDMLDSHEDLVDLFNLRDTHMQHFVRGELRPGANLCDIDTYTFHLDEDEAPSWWNCETADGVEQEVRRRVSAMIRTSGNIALMADGCLILGGTATIVKMVAGRVICLQDSAQVGKMQDSARVGVMRNSAQVGKMQDSARVGEMQDSAQVGEMQDSAQVEKMWGSAQAPRAPNSEFRKETES